MCGIKIYGEQNYQCKDCNRQFIGDHALTYNGCHSKIEDLIRLMILRGCGVRNIAKIVSVSIGKVLNTTGSSVYNMIPKKSCYERLEVDEFWTYVMCKAWLIHGYDPDTGKIVTYGWGKRDLKTAKKLRARLKHLKIHYGSISMDNCDSSKTACKLDKKQISKAHTVGIEGNNCRLRH